MHNGGIADFHKIKRKLQMSVRDEVFDWVTGNTGRVCQYHITEGDLTPLRFPMGIRTVSIKGKTSQCPERGDGDLPCPVS